MILFLPRLSLSLFLLSALSPATTKAQECKACTFDGNDAADCIIYGKIDDQVVEWSAANIECKEEYNIAISGIDPSSSCASANSFVNSLRFGDLQNSMSKLGLGVASEGGAFFEQNPDNMNQIDIIDTINISGEAENCVDSPSDCWNAMKVYFNDGGDGAKEMAQVCETLFDKVRVDKNLEESTLRIRICMEITDGTTVSLSCEPLAQQVKDAMEANPDTDCSGFGFEAPLSSVAGCEDVLKSSNSTIGDEESGATTQTFKEIAFAGALFFSLSMVGLV